MDRMLTEVTAFSLLPMLYIIPAIVSAKNSFKLKQVYPSSISCRIRFRLELKKKKNLKLGLHILNYVISTTVHILSQKEMA